MRSARWRRRRQESGVALLFALGTLTLLLSLGMAFVANMMAENRQTENFIRSLQARSAAQGGLDRAVAELRLAAETSFAAASNQPWYCRSAIQPSFQRVGCNDSGLVGSSARYTLKILDTASRLHLNDENPNLASMLKNLPGLGTALANRIKTTRQNSLPHRRYAAAGQVKLVTGLGDTIFKGLRDSVTVTGYVDPNTMDLASGGPAPIFQDSPRSPININTAGRDVLAAAMEPILSNLAEAQRVADDLIFWQGRSASAPRAMATWQDYAQWWQGVRARTGISATEEKNLKDNFNPNRKNAWSKTSATTAHAKYATEFCFHSGGIYDIQSTGEVLSFSGASLASITVSITAPVFNLATVTKKQQFRGEDANFNGVLDSGEDTNGNGVLDKPEFRNVTWRDNCPVNSADDLDIGYRSNYETVNDSLKLGFWEDFDEDESAAFSSAAWVNIHKVQSPGSGFALEHSDSRGSGNQFHHTTAIALNPSDPKSYYKSRFGVFELAYPGYRDPYAGVSGAVLLNRPGWSFGNAYIRVDVLEDDDTLKNNSDAGHDDVAWLSFRHGGGSTTSSATVYARYPNGIDYYASGADEWSASTIYQAPPQGIQEDMAWEADTGGNPYNYASREPGRKPTLVIKEADNSTLHRPLMPAAVVTSTDEILETKIKLPPRLVLMLSPTPVPADSGLPRPGGLSIGDGKGNGVYVFGENPSTPYAYQPRRTYHVYAVNRIVQGIGEVYVPGVYLELAQQGKLGGMISKVRYPDSGMASSGYRGEINTYIGPEGTLKLANHGSFPSWDNIRIITSVGEFQSPIIDAGTDQVHWGTLSWTVTIPSSADAQHERVSFEPWTFQSKTDAEACYILDQQQYKSPQKYMDSWPKFRYADKGESGFSEPNIIGSGLAYEQPKGRLQESGASLVGLYPRNWSPSSRPLDDPTLAHHGQRYLVYKLWLTSERYATFAGPYTLPGDPTSDDTHLLKETPVLEDVTVTYMPPARITGFREGPA